MNKQKLVGNLSRGLTFVLSAPAGTGKSTLVNMLTEEFPVVIRSISCTTRAPRKGEVEGVDYYFLSEEEFENKVKAQDFVEHVSLFGYRYGTSKAFLTRSLEEGKHVFLIIDTQGAASLMTKLDAIFIFLMPPTIDELQRRLRMRGSETEETFTKRLKEAEREMKAASTYRYVIINDDLHTAYQVLRSIVIAEEHKGRI